MVLCRCSSGRAFWMVLPWTAHKNQRWFLQCVLFLLQLSSGTRRGRAIRLWLFPLLLRVRERRHTAQRAVGSGPRCRWLLAARGGGAIVPDAVAGARAFDITRIDLSTRGVRWRR